MSAFTGFSRYRGLAFIALWQAAPVVVHQDSAGRVQIHFAGGGGRYEEVTTNCEGEVVGTEDFGYSGGGAAVEVWPADWARLNAFGGMVHSGSADFSDLNMGVLAALETRYFGLGAGGTIAPGGETTFETPDGDVTTSDPADYYPVLYARLGNLDRLHLRFESTSSNGVERMGGLLRLGFGYNQGLLRGTRAFGGIAACHAGCDFDEGETAVVFLDLSRPVTDHFDVRLGGVVGAGEANPEFGFTIGGSWLPQAIGAAPTGSLPAPEFPTAP